MSISIEVCPANAVESLLKSSEISHVISLMGPKAGDQRPKFISKSHHLDLRFNDIVEPRPNLVTPNATHIDSLLRFAEAWQKSGEKRLLIHCWFGISRSPAAAFIVAVHLQPGKIEQEIAGQLRSLAPTATPNAMMIAIADDIMLRNGRMVEAIRQIGRGADASEGDGFSMPLQAERV